MDSITSFDDRMQSIGRATARILNRLSIDFGILGKMEMDSGHEVRRFGEEMLFQDLRDKNTNAILSCGATRIVTADPHAYNALKNDYTGIPPVEHISQFLMRRFRQGAFRLNPLEDPSRTYTYHDPCSLGRHNRVYDDPRNLLDAVPGLRRVDMKRCRDRSFCCGGGGLMLFYEPNEKERMGVLRVKMAAEAGAGVIVTACPFCLANMEDAIKVAGLEGRMEAVKWLNWWPGNSHNAWIGRVLISIHHRPGPISEVFMEILVCVKRVPDTAENEISITADGTGINEDDLVYSVNEWDNYAVEEALQIRDKAGGSATVVTVGGEEAEEVLRRQMAMGADSGILICDDAFHGSDGRGIAAILKAEIEKGKYDLVFTGAQADDGAGQVGGMLAAMLDWPYAALVNFIDIQDGKTIKVGREVEGGNQEMNAIELPCVLSIQTGINEPRYVGIRGIRKVASVEIPRHGIADLELAADSVGTAGARVERLDYFTPEPEKGAEMLEGSMEEKADKLIELLKAKGGIK